MIRGWIDLARMILRPPWVRDGTLACGVPRVRRLSRVDVVRAVWRGLTARGKAHAA